MPERLYFSFELEEQIAAYLPLISDKLSSFSRKDIIKRFVSLAFNKFLKYYKNLKDLKPVKESAQRHSRATGRETKKKRSHFIVSVLAG